MTDKARNPCWLHPDEPVPGCADCPPTEYTCIAHGPYYGGALSCPRCLTEMQRHKTRARNALIDILRELRKAKKPKPNLLFCAKARSDQMGEVVKSLGLDIEIRPVEDFPWEKFQVARRSP